MRARIDISEIEAETKIRAKYLRALENEEWDLLPGPTFVKSFLRTYAEALGIDAKLLVEEYKLRQKDLVGVGVPLIICHLGKVMFVVGYEGVFRFLGAFRHNVSVNFDQNCIANAVLILVERGPLIYRTLRCSELNAVSRLNYG